jgi:heat shock protein HslJ
MSRHNRIDTWTVRRFALAVVVGTIADTAAAQSIEGTAAYRERMALPPSAVFEATLEDVSRADARAETIARTRVASPGAAPVITHGNPARVSLMLRRVGAAQTTPPNPTGTLADTSWQLVKFQGSDGTTLTPDDRSRYTIEFGARGQLTARVDCYRGRGTWKSGGTNQVQFGPLALTRAMCPTGSLHDHIVKQWGYIRSYVIKDGHLFLSLMADGGIYEFEPVTKTGEQAVSD